MKVLKDLKPQPLFDYFEKICQVPRPSKKEEKIRTFLIDFAKNNNLHVKTDEAGNVLISKPASPGKENVSVVILQTHMDMVCEKNRDKQFDFENDPIEPFIENGWIKANGTTLGADCGIGIAAQLAVLTSEKINHGPLECLITVDEETGLSGAFALKPGFMTGSVLLNLDSEDEGEIFIGCAGGIDTLVHFSYQQEKIPENFTCLKFSVSGLAGGHSGDDIHKNRGNAIKILARFLHETTQNENIRLVTFDGGNLRNAIPREAFAIIAVQKNHKNILLNSFEKFKSQVNFEFEKNEPQLALVVEDTDEPEKMTDFETQKNLSASLIACPHGVLEMSTRMEGMVETSSNLASVKFDKNRISVVTSQRSELESRKNYAAAMVRSVFELAGANVTHSEGYPGWTPQPDSKILQTTVDSYQKLFGKTPAVRSIHAGLECGLFLKIYPELDMVSFGPTIKGAHSPDERLDIKSTGKFWKHLVDVLEQME